MNLWNKSEIIALLQRHNLWTKKKFGQNFLVNKGALDKIVEAAQISSEDVVIEVGPGVGVLTQELAQHAKKVVSVELDDTLFPVLNETVGTHPNVEIIHSDVLQWEPPNTDYKVVANIPYNITSPLLNHFLKRPNQPSTMTLLVQKEVAEKICDKKVKSVLALQVRLFADPQYIKKVAAGSFHPAPRVDSAIIHLTVRQPGHSDYFELEEAFAILKVAKAAFSGKRKKLSNTLKPFNIELPEDLADLRPEHLSLSNWRRLCQKANQD